MLLFVAILACEAPRAAYDHDIGYINPENALGPANFETCGGRIFEYYNSSPAAGYKYGKKALRDSVMHHFTQTSNDSGYLVIRFIINCKGLAGRFEIIEDDLNLNPGHFSEQTKTSLLTIVMNLNEWSPVVLAGEARDAYMYLNFRIENGNIIEILP